MVGALRAIEVSRAQTFLLERIDCPVYEFASQDGHSIPAAESIYSQTEQHKENYSSQPLHKIISMIKDIENFDVPFQFGWY